MTKLIQCVECNKPVSSDLYTCPHCKMPPKGVVCHICLEPLKKSDAGGFYGLTDRDKGRHHIYFENHYGYAYPGPDKFAHKSCQGKIRRDLDLIDNKKSFDCPTCNNSILVHNFYLDFSGKKIESSHKLVCKNCGHRFEQVVYDSPLVECTYCDFPVEKDAAIKISLPYNNVSSYAYLPISNQANTPHHAHKICYASKRQEIVSKHHDAFEIQKKIDIKENNQSSKESKSRKISHTIHRLCNFLLTVIAPIYFVYALITGNGVGIAFFIATIGFLGRQLNSSSPKQNVKAHKQKINTPKDALRLPKGGYATFRFKYDGNSSSTSRKIDFDDEILLDILSEHLSYTGVEVCTQAEAITRVTHGEKLPLESSFAKILLKLRSKRLYCKDCG